MIFTEIFFNNHYKKCFKYIYKKNTIQSLISNTKLNYGYYISHQFLKYIIYMIIYMMVRIKYN